MSDSFATQWTVAFQAPLSMEFPRQYWSGLPCLPPGIFPTQRLNPCLMHWQSDSLPLSHLTVKEYQTSQVKEFSACLCMRKLKRSGLADVIPWYALCSLGQNTVFSHPESPQGAPWRWLQRLTSSWGVGASCLHPEFPQGLWSRWLVMWWLEGCSILVYQYGSNICLSQTQGCNRQVLPTSKPPFFCRVQSQTLCHHSPVFEGIKDRLLWTCQYLPGSRQNCHRMPDSLVLPTPGLDFLLYLGPIYLFLFIVSCGIRNHSSPTRYQTHNPCSGTQSLNHWTTKESSESGELAFIKRAGVKKKKKKEFWGFQKRAGFMPFILGH